MVSSRRLHEMYDEDDHVFRSTMSALGGTLLRNRLVVGSLTAFLITFSYVAANALWYQPHAHKSALFPTRAMANYQAPTPALQTPMTETKTRIVVIERQPQPPAPPAGDSQIATVQEVLSGLNLYQGPVDGLSGPKTRAAITKYQRIVGLSADGEISVALLQQLAGPEPVAKTVPLPVADAVPLPTPRPDGAGGARRVEPLPSAEITASIGQEGGAVKRAQAGLRAFGHDKIEIDGKIGSLTERALVEFQSLFGLPQSGKVDGQTIAKMQEIGLIN